MNRLASAVSLALVFTVAACGDDDKPKVNDAAAGGTGGTAGSAGTGGSGGGTGGGGGGGSTGTACTGSFAGITQVQLAGAIAMSMGPKNCAAAADVALICTGNVVSIAGSCGLECLMMTEDAAKVCIASCIKKKVQLSDACNGCYAATVACAQTNCLLQCAANPAAEMCTKCQIDKGCRTAFAMCSGLPTPGAAPDGGAGGDGGGNTGDGGAIDAASTEAGTSADGGVDAAVTTDTAVTPDTAVTADTAAADTAVSTDSSTD
jgi:hypothetical protein